MNQNLTTKAIELSFTVLEDIIMLKPLTNKEDLMKLAHSAMQKVSTSKSYPEVLKLAYQEMIHKLEGLTFEEIKEIRQIIEE